MGLSNILVGILNFLTFLLSWLIIGAGIWLGKQAHSDCYAFLSSPAITLGVFILLISMAGFFGSTYRISLLMYIYLIVTCILIFLLFVFTVMAFVVTNKSVGSAVGNKGYGEYKLGDYSTWLRRRVEKDSNWRVIRSCLVEARLCRILQDPARLTPAQAGCCRPPSECGCASKNATYWEACTNPSYSSDCTSYGTSSTELCFACASCKAGVLRNINKDWRRLAEANILLLIFLVVVYSLGCCAVRNVQSHHQHHRGYVKRGFA